MGKLLLGALLVFCSGAGFGQVHDQASAAFAGQKARQFDFWVGAWSVNLRIQEQDGSWKDRIQAKAHIYRILDGKGILELWDSPRIKGFSLRYYDPAQDRWVLWLNWPSPNRSANSSLTGAFRHGRGEFFSTSKNAQGEEVLSRYTFCDIAADRLRWDDAYTKDGGKTWTHSWIMEFSREADLAPWPERGFEAHTYAGPGRCDTPEFERLDAFAGRWRGQWEFLIDGRWQAREATLSGYRMNRGCGLVQFFESGPFKEFALLTFDGRRNAYERLSLDNRENTGVRRRFGAAEERAWTLTEEGDGETRAVWRLETDSLLRVAVRRKSADGSWRDIARGSLTRTERP